MPNSFEYFEHKVIEEVEKDARIFRIWKIPVWIVVLSLLVYYGWRPVIVPTAMFGSYVHHRYSTLPPPPPAAPGPPESKYLKYSLWRTGPIYIAQVFGRTKDCQDVDVEMIAKINEAAMHHGLDPRLVAATIAVESACNNYSISNKGAVGLMQIHVKAWKDKYDFTRVNLFDPVQNIRVGCDILRKNIDTAGDVGKGLRLYNGVGEGEDPYYISKIQTLAYGK